LSTPVRRHFGRRKFDTQPTQSAPVLIAAPMGDPIPASAVNLALELSGGAAVAVVTIARVYGSKYGLMNPGLLPSRKEMDAQKSQVETAVKLIERGGVEAWGQIAASRKPVRTVTQAARARSAQHVIVVRTEQTQRWRQVVEGDIVKDISRRLGPDVHVEGVSP
jgi:alkylated DNA nucleotide flippase Atl1